MEDHYLNWPEVRRISGNRSRATVWRWERLGLFPKRTKIGPNSVAWLERHIQKWVDEKATEQNNAE